MYLHHFGFDEPPFSITPDPKFVFLSSKHEESLAHLVYGISRGGGAGFVQLTGEVGTGKTTISRLLLEQIPDKTNIALILNPNITPLELIQNICKELKISMRGIKGKLNTLVDKLNNYLLQSWSNGENTVVIIDEAQNLPRDTLEQLRLLTNLETNTHKLLQIILIGQPELRSTMRRNDLRQLAQRVTARYHLMPLSAVETYDYLQHRIKVAGGLGAIVSQSTAKKAHKITAGVPRLLNILMDRALLAAYSENSTKVTNKHLKIAAQEVMPENTQKQIFNIWKWLGIVILLISVIAFGFYLNKNITNAINENYNLKPKPTYQNIKLASPKNAWSNYFKLWDANNDKNWQKLQCPKSTDTGMACLRKQGNFKQIQKINHPVLLLLDDNKVALIKKINHNKISILNTHNQFVTTDEMLLNKNWLGTYFIIWPMPAHLLVNPSTEDLQSWALEMANTLSLETVTVTNLKQWIIEFQKQQGLLADGIIGKETQMSLSLLAYNGPTLDN